MGKSKRINFLTTTSGETPGFQLVLRSVLLRLVLVFIVILIASFAGSFGLRAYSASRIATITEERQGYQAQIDFRNSINEQSSSFNSTLTALNTQSAAMALEPNINSTMILSVLERAGTEIRITNYNYSKDSRSGLYILILTGNAPVAVDPLDYVESLRQMPDFNAVSLSAVSLDGTEFVANFSIACVLRGAEDETE